MAKKLKDRNREQAIENFGKSTEDTNIERKIENFLLINDILYVKQFKYKYGIADFWLPETNTIIEADGEYWHNLPGSKRRDYLQTKYLEKEDFNVIRLLGSQILDNFSECSNIIQNAV